RAIDGARFGLRQAAHPRGPRESRSTRASLIVLSRLPCDAEATSARADAEGRSEARLLRLGRWRRRGARDPAAASEPGAVGGLGEHLPSPRDALPDDRLRR